MYYFRVAAAAAATYKHKILKQKKKPTTKKKIHEIYFVFEFILLILLFSVNWKASTKKLAENDEGNMATILEFTAITVGHGPLIRYVWLWIRVVGVVAVILSSSSPALIQSGFAQCLCVCVGRARTHTHRHDCFSIPFFSFFFCLKCPNHFLFILNNTPWYLFAERKRTICNMYLFVYINKTVHFSFFFLASPRSTKTHFFLHIIWLQVQK